MSYSILKLVGDEAALNNLVSGLSSLVLLGLIVLCIAVLSKGADWMIDGVVQLAERTGLPKIVIGATIVSLGTTMPEAFVSVMAAFMGNPGLALGNGVGSIIADTGLVFGLTCIMAAVPLNRYILNRTGWVQVGSATLLVLIALLSLALSSGNGAMIHRWVGWLFLFLLVAYMCATYTWARKSNAGIPVSMHEENEKEETRPMGPWLCWAFIVGGLAMVVGGARVLVPSASQIAWRIGVPDDVIAATLVAFGTSLPELMTAFTAVRKGHPEITVGNIVGADVLNCLFVIGAAAACRPLAIPPNFFYFHFPALLIILYSFRVFIFINKAGYFRRWQGFWLLGIYLIYLVLQYALNLRLDLH